MNKNKEREMRFFLPLPLDVEPLLEAMMSKRVMLLPFRARSAGAGDVVAKLIREAAQRQGIDLRGSDDDAAPVKAAKPTKAKIERVRL